MILRTYCFSAFFAVVCFLVVVSPGVSFGVTVDRILATIDDQVITLADYRLFAKELTAGQADDDVDEGLLRQLVEEKLIAREAVRRGLEASDEEVEQAIQEFKSLNGLSQNDLETFLKEDGTDMEKFRAVVRERILISRMLGSEVDAKVLVTDPEIDAFYESHKQEFLDTPEKHPCPFDSRIRFRCIRTSRVAPPCTEGLPLDLYENRNDSPPCSRCFDDSPGYSDASRHKICRGRRANHSGNALSLHVHNDCLRGNLRISFPRRIGDNAEDAHE